ncbi:MAG: hypothetical protein JXQ27_15720 [Acidobacteria bacterium]|nr:hypothetical protein [Acidobacteriota bacterium]
MRTQVFGRIGLLILLAGMLAAPVAANDMQRDIANAGINLGCLASYVERFGITPENSAMITFWMATVNDELNEIIARYQAPFDPSGVRAVAESLQRFNATTAGWNNSQRGAFFHGLYSRLKQQFSIAYHSQRGLYYCATCDTFVLDFGYHYGRAWIGAWVGDGYLHSSGHSGMNLAISEGLKCANTLGCNFPFNEMWAGLNLQNVDTEPEFRAAVGPTLDVITSLGAVSMSAPLIPSTPRTAAPPPPSGPALEGLWRSGATNDVIRFERQGDVIRGYVAEIGRSMLSQVGDLMGEFTQTGPNIYSGKLTMKTADGNVSWLDGVRITVSGQTATATAPWWNAPVTYSRVQ